MTCKSFWNTHDINWFFPKRFLQQWCNQIFLECYRILFIIVRPINRCNHKTNWRTYPSFWNIWYGLLVSVHVAIKIDSCFFTTQVRSYNVLITKTTDFDNVYCSPNFSFDFLQTDYKLHVLFQIPCQIWQWVVVRKNGAPILIFEISRLHQMDPFQGNLQFTY